MLAIVRAVLLSSAVSAPTAAQAPNAPQPSAPAKPHVDPITVRGCLDGQRLRIVEHDVAELSGATHVRLKGRRGVLKLLRDQNDGRIAYIEVTGQLHVPAVDRIETRMKRKVGKRSTISVGAAAEQHQPEVAPPSELTVEAFTVIAPTCPVSR
jgi:hypothetical protein